MYSFFSAASTNAPPAEDDYIDEIIYEEEEEAAALPTRALPAGKNNDTNHGASSKPPVTPGNCSSWNEAHDHYCRRKGRLRSTIQEIWDYFYGGEQQEDALELPWALPTSSTAVTGIADLSLPIHASHSTTTATATTKAAEEAASTAASGLVWGLAKRAASGLYSTVFSGESDGIASTYDRADDANIYGNPSLATTAATSYHEELPWDQLIIHVKLVQETFIALQAYHRRCCNLRLYDPGPIILKRSEWIPWLMASEDPLLKGISPEDASWFLEALAAHQIVRFWKRDSSIQSRAELILLSNLEVGIAEANTINDSDNNFEAFVTLYELKESQKIVESQIDRWTEQISEANQKALKYKRQGQTKLALGQLSKRKMLQAQIDRSSSNLIQLEQIQATIDTAQSNQALVDLMAQGTQLLQKLNKSSDSPSLEEIDDLKEDLLDEMDHVRDVHKALVSTSTTGNCEDDDELLLKELESLSLVQPQHDSLPLTKTIHEDGNEEMEKCANTASTLKLKLKPKSIAPLPAQIAS